MSTTAPRFGRFTTPPKSGKVTLQVHFHDPAKVRDVCRALAQRGHPGPLPVGAPACVDDRFTPGIDHMHVAMPRDWDDLDVVVQLGHELLHSLGAHHA